MFKQTIKKILSLAFIFFSGEPFASSDITAEFVANLNNITHNEFNITSSNSGFCANYPSTCQANGWISSTLAISVPRSYPVPRQPDASNIRDGLMVKIPSAYRTISIYNESSNHTSSLRIRAGGVFFRIPDETANSSYYGGGHDYPPESIDGNCSKVLSTHIGGVVRYLGYGITRNSVDVTCYKRSTIIRDSDGPSSLDTVSLSFELVTPEPLKLRTGIYKGQWTLTMGPGGDVDFGDNFIPNVSSRTFTFELKVTHDFILNSFENKVVTLQPCAFGKSCTPAEINNNWDRWLISLVPPELTGRSSFNFSSSGGFRMIRRCEYYDGTFCALKNENSDHSVRLDVYYTLPLSFTDNQGQPFIQRELTYYESNAPFINSGNVQSGVTGYIEFRLRKTNVDQLIKNRPDQYRGTVTVIFEPNI